MLGKEIQFFRLVFLLTFVRPMVGGLVIPPPFFTIFGSFRGKYSYIVENKCKRMEEILNARRDT
jgi:hypothetical protein